MANTAIVGINWGDEGKGRIFYYDDYLIIIMNGGKGLVTAENIPLKSIENSLIIDIPGTFSGSSVCQPAPPNKKHTLMGVFFIWRSGNRTHLNVTARRAVTRRQLDDGDTIT